jgi:hypothetical protein
MIYDLKLLNNINLLSEIENEFEFMGEIISEKYKTLLNQAKLNGLIIRNNRVFLD